MRRVQLAVLGSLSITCEGVDIPLVGNRRRTLMAALAVRRGARCTAEWLADVVWQAEPPPGAAATLQSHISILRRLLDTNPQAGTTSVIRTVPEGYLLDTAEVDVDADRFVAALLEARRASDPMSALDHLEAALNLWGGIPFAEHADLEPFRGEVARLEGLAAEAQTIRMTTLALLGRDADVIAYGELAIAEHPLRERPWGLLAEALYRTGRQADALRSLNQLRSVLADTLGILPSSEVQDLERRILNQDPTLESRPAVVATTPAERPATLYAPIDGVHIAYQVVGNAGPWLVAAPPFAQNIEVCWEDHHHRRLIERVAKSCRFVHFDKRGTGMSDRAAGLSMSERLSDFTAVLDEANIDRAVLCGVSEGGPVAIAFAAEHPERVAGLYLVNTYARLMVAPDYPIGTSSDQFQARTALWASTWGRDSSDLVDWFAPSLSNDPLYRAWLAFYMRQSCSPGTLAAINVANASIDVRSLLSQISVPTVVVHRAGDRVAPVEWGRYLASHIPNARYVELAGCDHLPWVGDNWADIVDMGVELAHSTLRSGGSKRHVVDP
jgi:pimeloyl-ACP methyl ester carboxylesterase/DNA-binding SARP family transcriptional activator